MDNKKYILSIFLFCIFIATFMLAIHTLIVANAQQVEEVPYYYDVIIGRFAITKWYDDKEGVLCYILDDNNMGSITCLK